MQSQVHISLHIYTYIYMLVCCPQRVRYEPIGVVGNISAWNFPYFVGSNVWIPALLTGNAVMYKPSEWTLQTGRRVAELMVEVS
jgi:acyl-CoA reductase-like NAD-dependent aldehyde dehydrogenase